MSLWNEPGERNLWNAIYGMQLMGRNQREATNGIHPHVLAFCMPSVLNVDSPFPMIERFVYENSDLRDEAYETRPLWRTGEIQPNGASAHSRPSGSPKFLR